MIDIIDKISIYRSKIQMLGKSSSQCRNPVCHDEMKNYDVKRNSSQMVKS